MLNHNLVLKSEELFLVGSLSNDGRRDDARGLYARDTRYLSRFSVTMNGSPPEILSAHTHDATRATVTCANPRLTLADGTTLSPHLISLEQRVNLDECLRVTLNLQNFAKRPLNFSLTFQIAADFRDLFDIRGFAREQRGQLQNPEVGDGTITFGYRGRDGRVAETLVTFDRGPRVSMRGDPPTQDDAPTVHHAVGPGGSPDFELEAMPEVQARFDVSLEPLERFSVTACVTPRPAAGPPVAAVARDRMPSAAVTSDNPMFDRVMDRCHLDLRALDTMFPHGELPAAGIPWYVAPFGRDSLITGLQTLHLDPQRAVGALRVLAALQGTKIDDYREEEPGKSLHEMRYGEMARLGEVPHTPYYGSVDATPLWIWLFAETVAWTGDDDLYQELLPNALQALEWIEQYGDRDGDGLVEYSTAARSGSHIKHQVWKDSFDSLNDANGLPVEGLVASVEVQGYVYAALARLAWVAGVMGDEAWAATLRTRAERVRVLVEDRYWLETEGFYAQALNAAKQPVRVMSSNPGHLLLCGLPSEERAARMVARFRQPDMESGWGIRTLSKDAPSYNPMSYHNGSIWPHDNSLIGAGFYRYAQIEAGHAVTGALFNVAKTDPLGRLQELYCGFPRAGDGDDAPVNYPVSCSPQAWAAGSLPFLVKAMLGLDVDLAARRLTISPSLPGWLNELTISGLTVLGQRGSLTIRRQGDELVVESIDVPLGPPLPGAECSTSP